MRQAGDAGRRQVRLAGAPLGSSRHVCAFFNSKDEEYRVLLPFIKEGLELGDKAFHIVKDDHRTEHRRRLRLTEEPVEAFRSGADVGAEYLQGHPALLASIVCTEDGP